jgi:hypothetical protein
MNLATSFAPAMAFDYPKSGEIVASGAAVYFFLDYSNIAISAQNRAWLEDGYMCRHRVRLHAANIRAIAERNRRWKLGFAAVGLNTDYKRLSDRFEEAGIRIHVSERGGNSNREQNVDERIQYEMLKLTKKSNERGTVVLATGDGAAASESDGFKSVLENLLEHGYLIELMSWHGSVNFNLRNWAERHGRYIELDDFYNEITFIDGGRQASSLHLVNRKIARKGLIGGRL